MKGKDCVSVARGVELVNLQKRYRVQTASLLAFALDLKRRLPLGKRKFNICFVDDNAIRNLNLAFRGQDKPTDVLSFPWNEAGGAPPLEARLRSHRGGQHGITDFLGDVVISVQTAGRNAGAEGHSTLSEIRWLILHGVLHLLGYDHEHDTGEMMSLELALREQLGVAGRPALIRQVKRQNAKGKRQSPGRLNF